VNTTVLLQSGVSITVAHHAILTRKYKLSTSSLIITIILGIYFTILQLFEYFETTFSLNDSIYGSTFFIATGFHGLHVIVGSTFLIINLFKLTKKIHSPHHHLGFEIAA